MRDMLVLVAEDNPEIRHFLVDSVLTPNGYEARAVGDGASARAQVLEINPDLVISDNHMPGLSGIDLIRGLQSEAPHVPCILITSEGSEELAVEAFRAGAVDYLTKPFSVESLLDAVQRAVNKGKAGPMLSPAQNPALKVQESLRHRLESLEALSSIGRRVTSQLDLDEILSMVVEEAVRLTGTEEGSLLLLDEVSGELYMRASKNIDEKFARTFRVPVRDSLAGQVIRTGEPIILDGNTPQKIKTNYLVHSLVYVPLRVGDRRTGVLGVDNRSEGRSFTNVDLNLIQAMADFAAIAIENASLFQQSEVTRKKLEATLTQTQNGIVLLDTKGTLVLINRFAQTALGIGEDATGESAMKVFQNTQFLEVIRAADGVPRRQEVATSDGRVFEAQRTPIEGVGQVVVMHDITHLKELDRIKSEFVTTVSHDLRSPLTAILGYVELIERSGEVNEQQREFIQRVRLSVGNITEMISDLLDLGRIEAELDVTRERVPIDMLVRFALENHRSAVGDRGLELGVDLPDQPPMIVCDAMRVRQMIGNLLENAIKYTPPGGKVALSVKLEGDQVILQVTDNGLGIPSKDLPYIFDRFFRGSNVSEDQTGTGLGLSIVKSIVDKHGGRIWVDSRLGRGTTFTVVLLRAED